MRCLMITSLMVALTLSGQVNAQNAQAGSGSQSPLAAAPEETKDVAPAHVSTGWSTLLQDTGRDFVALPKRKSTWVILGIGAATALGARLEDDYVEEHVVGDKSMNRVFGLGQWVGSTYVQAGTAVGLWAVGRYAIAPATGDSKTNKYSEMGFDLIRAQIVSQTIVQGMKHTIRRDRPTGECCAFPSGHAASAFAAAAVLERHLGYRASWPALAAAMYVGASRLVDNRHFLSDVMFGAAVGTASGWTVVGRHGQNQYSVQPVPLQGGMMIAVTRVES